MDSVNNQRTVAFLEDLNVRLKRFDEMILQAREDITKAVATLNATREATNRIYNDLPDNDLPDYVVSREIEREREAPWTRGCL